MSRSFILINNNSTKLGHITNNPSSSDLTKDKKNKVICIDSQSTPQKDIKNGPIFKICKPPTKCCNNPSYNKTILNSNLHTYEDLNDITTIQLNNSNALNLTPLYNNYTIDPDGSLFGETPCELNNYIQFRQPLVNPYPTPQTPSNVVALVLGTYDDPSIQVSWDYVVEPKIVIVSYSIYGYDVDPDTNITTPFGPFTINAYTYTYLLTPSTYDLQLSHSYYFQVYANTNFTTSTGGTSNTVLLAYAPEPATVGPTFTLYSSTPLSSSYRLLQLSQKTYAAIITWTNSSVYTGTNILSYTIHIFDNNGYDQTYTTSTSDTTYIIEGLQEFINYTIDIIVNNSAGSSQPERTNYTIGINFNFNYKTTNAAITTTDVLDHLPFIMGNGLTIDMNTVYVNILEDAVDPTHRLVSVEIPHDSITFTDNTTTNDGLSFSPFSNYYLEETRSITEINILYFGNHSSSQPNNNIPLSRGGSQFGLSTAVGINDDSTVLLTISNSDTPYILTNTSFKYMFRKLTYFNSDISNWSISNVISMEQMFLRASSFNQDISSWVVSNVTNMNNMFNNAIAFNNGEVGTNNEQHPLTWNTTALSNIEGMFTSAVAFNQDISSFTLSGVQTMQFLFQYATLFNQDISSWDVSNATNMGQMFQLATAFNQNLDNWGTKVSNVTNMDYMFLSATNFNNGGVDGDTTYPMTSWNVSNVTTRIDFGTNSKLHYTGNPVGNIQPGYWEYVPSASTNVSANYTSGTYDNYSVLLTWDSVVGATSYNVKLTTNITDSILSTTTNSYTFSGLSIVNTYSFFVQAVNSNGGTGVYTSATISSATVGTATAVSGINSTTSINYADITLTGSNYGPFYKLTTSPNTRVSTSNADTWVTSTSTTNITSRIEQLITNFNYGFSITAYNIAGASSSTSISNFKPVNNFIFSYIASELPPLGTTSGDATQQQREGIYNYLPFYLGTSVAATGLLTLNPLLYTSNQFITWTLDSTTLNYSVNISFPQTYTDSFGTTTTLWTYATRTNAITASDSKMAGITIDYNDNINRGIYYRSKCTVLSYNNFGSIPIASAKALCYIEQPGYTNIFNITNNSIPIILSGSSVKLGVYLKPALGSSINLSNWDLLPALRLEFAYSCDFTNVDINISNWNTSNILNIGSLFRSTIFKSSNNMDLNWNLSNLEGAAFIDAFQNSNFNSKLNFIFSTTKSLNMERMFRGASAFNQDINTTYDATGNPIYWNVSRVTGMNQMFSGCTNFNQPLNNWNVSNVTNMADMFNGATTFNQPLNDWTVSSVITMSKMFLNANAFNMPVDSWNVSNVIDMSYIFANSFVFNQPLNNWNVSNVTNMFQMFYNCFNFNQPINSWNVSKVTNMSYMFYQAAIFNQPINSWNVSSVTNMSYMFYSSKFNQPLGSWNVSNVTNMSYMFYQAAIFNQPINSWNVFKVTNMSQMFNGATNFNQDLDLWNVSNVTNMNRLFTLCSNFNGKISNWNVSNATDIAFMFAFALKFNQNLSNWDVTKKANMEQLFISASKFNNGELGYVDIPTATITPSTSSYVFSTSVLTCPGATFTTSGLSVGDILIITTTSSIVYAAQITSITDDTHVTLSPAYTSNITSTQITSITKQVAGTAPLTWDTGSFTTCLQMFTNCTYFNQRLISKTSGPWNMTKVTNVNQMFYGNAISTLGGVTNKSLFNNGELITNASQPLNWTLNTTTPTSTDWHTNCVLTAGNGVTTPSIY